MVLWLISARPVIHCPVNESDMYQNSIITEIIPLDIFYIAENYHQNYYRLNHLYFKGGLNDKLKRKENIVIMRITI